MHNFQLQNEIKIIKDEVAKFKSQSFSDLDLKMKSIYALADKFTQIFKFATENKQLSLLVLDFIANPNLWLISYNHPFTHKQDRLLPDLSECARENSNRF